MRRRDEEYTAFVRAVWPRLFRSAYALCGDHQLAQDAAQAALIKAYASWRRVRRADSPEAYVRQMVVNELRGWWRRKAYRSERATEDLDLRQVDSPENQLATSDQIWRGLATLPPRQRAVLVLRYFEDLSERQIADQLGIRPGTVKSQAAAALAKLRSGFTHELVTKGDVR
ncbi:MAG: SigE family RNA polymerase sigma factor [Micromonosporaceae bacterium]